MGAPMAAAVRCVFPGRITFSNVFASRQSRRVFACGASNEPLMARIGIVSFVRSGDGAVAPAGDALAAGTVRNGLIALAVVAIVECHDAMLLRQHLRDACRNHIRRAESV